MMYLAAPGYVIILPVNKAYFEVHCHLPFLKIRRVVTKMSY
jgi:hypothetical protein